MLNRIYFTFLIAVSILLSCAVEPSEESIYQAKILKKNDTSTTYNESDYGCTDSVSFSYDSKAIIDDGSCEFNVGDLHYSDDKNTAYSDSARTKPITGIIYDNTKSLILKGDIYVFNGKRVGDESLSNWLESDAGDGLLKAFIAFLILLIFIIVLIRTMLKWRRRRKLNKKTESLKEYNSSRKN